MCSVERYSSSSCGALLVGVLEQAERARRRAARRAPSRHSPAAASPSSSSTRRRTASRSTPMRSITPVTTPSGWSSSARRRCSGAISVFPASRAQRLRGAERLLGLAGESVGIELPCRFLWAIPGDVTVSCSKRTTVAARSGTSSRRYCRCAASTRCFHLLAQRVDARLELGDALARGRAARLRARGSAARPTSDTPSLRELLDAAQQLDVAVGVAPAATARARGLEQALALVDAQRLRVHPRELGRDRDHVERPRRQRPSELLRFCCFANSAARGSSSSTCGERSRPPRAARR